jgi:hypothetical protein
VVEPTSLGAIRQDNWFVLLDPAWQPANPQTQAPPEAIVGGWMLDEDGKAGPFQPNPDYVPGDESTPTDPTDAVLRLIAAGQDVRDQLVPTVRDAVLEIAVDDHDQPIVSPAPDGVPCVLVVTASAHKARVDAQNWWPVVGAMLPEIVPDGVDILLNPGGPASFRLSTEALRAGAEASGKDG